MKENKKPIYIAPVQGHTDAAWRHFHHEIYGGNLTYFTPFMRYEHGKPRKQDIRDYTSALDDGIITEPQVIFRDMSELRPLLETLAETDTKNINLNMGCPFPLQTGRGRGAGFISNLAEMARLPETLATFPDVTFSVKMRLGYSDPDEWRGIIDTLNSMHLSHIDIHPRVARQQYGGELYMDRFEQILAQSKNPIVFNGEIKTPSDITEILARYPQLHGVMTGRGSLGRPSLAAEYESGEEWNRDERIDRMLTFHRRLFNHYNETLCGDTQVLSKIKPFWEYAEEEIGRKAWKAIKKAGNIAKYHSAVAMI